MIDCTNNCEKQSGAATQPAICDLTSIVGVDDKLSPQHCSSTTKRLKLDLFCLVYRTTEAFKNVSTPKPVFLSGTIYGCEKALISVDRM